MVHTLGVPIAWRRALPPAQMIRNQIPRNVAAEFFPSEVNQNDPNTGIGALPNGGGGGNITVGVRFGLRGPFLAIFFETFVATFFAGLPPRFFAPRFAAFFTTFRRAVTFFLDAAFLIMVSPVPR